MESNPETTLSFERAQAITDRLVDAWMVQNGMMEGPPPSVHGFSLAEAEEAQRIIASHPGYENGDGSKTLLCFVEPTRVARLYAWAVLQAEDTTYGKR